MDQKLFGGRIKSQPVAMAGITVLMIAMVSFLIAGNPPILMLSISIGLLMLAQFARHNEIEAAKVKIRIKDK